jgi:fucose permease
MNKILYRLNSYIYKRLKNPYVHMHLQQTILLSVQKDDLSFKGDGYVSLAILYICFSVSNFFAPSLVAVLKAKRTLIFCSLFYILFIANFIILRTWSLYLVSVLIGLAAAGLWTSQGTYLSLNSNKDTISRNTGIFWVFLSSW